MLSPSESQIQKSILDYLKLKQVLCFKHRNVGIKKPDGSFIPLAFGEKGISDIIGVLPKSGRFLAIEVKRPGQHPSQNQLDFIASVNGARGFAFWADSLDTVISVLTPHL